LGEGAAAAVEASHERLRARERRLGQDQMCVAYRLPELHLRLGSKVRTTRQKRLVKCRFSLEEKGCLLALLRRCVPGHVSLFTSGLRCRGFLSGKGRSSESDRKTQSDDRSKRLHRGSPLLVTTPFGSSLQIRLAAFTNTEANWR
jgi:hypothetical protein